jgi:hypothetical protein
MSLASTMASLKSAKQSVADSYAYLVPFVEEKDHFFLKTIIPSRKATRDYTKQGESDAED